MFSHSYFSSTYILFLPSYDPIKSLGEWVLSLTALSVRTGLSLCACVGCGDWRIELRQFGVKQEVCRCPSGWELQGPPPFDKVSIQSQWAGSKPARRAAARPSTGAVREVSLIHATLSCKWTHPRLNNSWNFYVCSLAFSLSLSLSLSISPSFSPLSPHSISASSPFQSTLSPPVIHKVVDETFKAF